MIRGLGLGAAALAGACFVACSSSPTVTAKVMTIDPREAGSVAQDARESETLVEPAVCESIPLADDVGCPDEEFPVGTCPTTDQRCLSPTSYDGVRAVFRCEANHYDATQPSMWAHEAYFYDAIPPQPNDQRLDTSDCTARPVIPCACRTGETLEHAIERNGTISRCQIVSPVVFVTFDDTGCPVRAQYGEAALGTAQFTTCLTDALSGLRFDCATKATRVVLMTESKE